MNRRATFSIGKVAKHSGLSVKTIRLGARDA